MLRKIHSLAGIFPIGIFILEHLFTNSFALQGSEVYDSKIRFLQSLPYLIGIEAILIALPIIFHGFYGLWLVYLARNNVLQYGYYRNWLFYLQRITAVITLVFVLWHVWTLRINPALAGSEVGFATVSNLLNNPVTMLVYPVGLTAAIFHFANGLWAFLVSWGITVGPRSQQVSSVICSFIFLVLTLVGIRALTAFM